jgi:hypothetical protein
MARVKMPIEQMNCHQYLGGSEIPWLFRRSNILLNNTVFPFNFWWFSSAGLKVKQLNGGVMFLSVLLASKAALAYLSWSFFSVEPLERVLPVRHDFLHLPAGQAPSTCWRSSCSLLSFWTHLVKAVFEGFWQVALLLALTKLYFMSVKELRLICWR